MGLDARSTEIWPSTTGKGPERSQVNRVAALSDQPVAYDAGGDAWMAGPLAGAQASRVREIGAAALAPGVGPCVGAGQPALGQPPGLTGTRPAIQLES